MFYFGRLKQIAPWCNGNTLGFGPNIPRSNRGGATPRKGLSSFTGRINVVKCETPKLIPVAKQADAPHSKCGPARGAGSIPAGGTKGLISWRNW